MLLGELLGEKVGERRQGKGRCMRHYGGCFHDEFLPEVGAFYVMDRGYIDFERLFISTLFEKVSILQPSETTDFQEDLAADQNQLIPFDF